MTLIFDGSDSTVLNPVDTFGKISGGKKSVGLFGVSSQLGLVTENLLVFVLSPVRELVVPKLVAEILLVFTSDIVVGDHEQVSAEVEVFSRLDVAAMDSNELHVGVVSFIEGAVES